MMVDFPAPLGPERMTARPLLMAVRRVGNRPGGGRAWRRDGWRLDGTGRAGAGRTFARVVIAGALAGGLRGIGVREGELVREVEAPGILFRMVWDGIEPDLDSLHEALGSEAGFGDGEDSALVVGQILISLVELRAERERLVELVVVLLEFGEGVAEMSVEEMKSGDQGEG